MSISENNLTKKRRIYNALRYRLLDRHYYGLTAKLRTLPDFIIIGVKRCGTTSLYRYLGEHPCIVSATRDNVGFFNNNFELGLDYYRSFFPTIWHKKRIYVKEKNFMAFEVTSSYIQESRTAENIFSVLPKIKLILIVRNPVDRAYSEYNLGKKIYNKTFEDLIFEEMERIKKEDKLLAEGKIVDLFEPRTYHLLRKCMYAKQLSPWFKLFPKEQILIISTEDFDSKTQDVYNEIFQFLGLPKYEMKKTEKINKGSYSKMNDQTRQLLIDYFKPHNNEFFHLIGKKFKWDS